MKNLKKLFATIALLVFMSISTSVMAQPDPGGGGDPGGGPVGSGAPIGGGLEILAVLGAAYAYSRFKMNPKIEE